MTISLTQDDQLLIDHYCDPEHKEDIVQLIQQYGSEDMIQQYPDRTSFFKTAIHRLKNNTLVGKTSYEVFGRQDTYLHIKKILTQAGATPDEIDDIAQETVMKFLRLGCVERFNPIVSTWPNFLLRGVRNSFLSYRTRGGVKKKKTFALDVLRDNNSAQEPVMTNLNPLEEFVAGESLEDLYRFIDNLPNYRSHKHKPAKWLATLKPPGTRECPLTTLREGYVVRLNEHTLRVTFPDNKAAFLFPRTLIKQIRQPKDPIILDDGPDRERHPRDILNALLAGRHIDEIVGDLKIGQSTVRTWIHDLELAFHRWWSKSIYVDESLRWMGTARSCPGCQQIIMKLPPLERRTAKIVRIVYRDHYQFDPIGQEVDGRWCPHCREWSVCKVDPGSVLRDYLKGQYPWDSPNLNRKRIGVDEGA